MELRDTIEMMQSEDYKERFKAEYFQVRIRIMKLSAMLEKYKNGTLDFKPSCKYDLLYRQCRHMIEYARCLEERATVEGIDLKEN